MRLPDMVLIITLAAKYLFTMPLITVFEKSILNFRVLFFKESEMLPAKHLKDLNLKHFRGVNHSLLFDIIRRVHKINLIKQNVSLSSVKGRVTATFSIPEYYKQYLEWEFKTSTLRYNKQQNVFYLHVVIHKPSPEPVGNKVLGIDRGIVNIAVTSNNHFFNSKPIKNVRAKYAFLRAKLQSKGTKSAKKLLRKISRKEQRFVSKVNHCISKEIVAMPFDIFAIEDLTSIRVQSRTRGIDFTQETQ